MKYNQELIDLIGENKIRKILLEDFETVKKVYLEFKNNQDVNDNNVKMRLAIENYILKYNLKTNDENLNNKMNKIINHVKKNAQNNPNYFKSLLLNNENINYLYNQNEIKEIQNTENLMSKTAHQIYKKWEQTKNLSESEKDILMNYFIKTSDDKRTGLNNAKEKYFAYLISDVNYKSTNKNEIEFLAKFAIKDAFEFSQDYKNVNPEICIASLLKDGTTHKNLGGYAQEESLIVINSDASLIHKNNLSLVHTICHEYTHIIQQYNSNKTKFGFYFYSYIRNDLIVKYPQKDEKGNLIDEYHMNYNFEEIELDAQKEGFRHAKIISDKYMKKYYNNELLERNKSSIEKEELEDKLRRPNPYNLKKIYDEQKHKYIRMSAENYNVTRMNSIIKNHPIELENYPMLKNFYNKNGDQKEFSEIISYKSINDNIMYNDFAHDYIIFGIMHGELDNFDVSKLPKDKQAWALGRILKCYEKEMQKLRESLEYYKVYKSQELEEENLPKVISATKKTINKLNIIGNYIDNNFDLIMNLSKECSDNNMAFVLSSSSISRCAINNNAWLKKYDNELNELDMLNFKEPITKGFKLFEKKCTFEEKDRILRKAEKCKEDKKYKNKVDNYSKILNHLKKSISIDDLNTKIETSLGVLSFSQYIDEIMPLLMHNNEKIEDKYGIYQTLEEHIDEKLEAINKTKEKDSHNFVK